MILFPITLATAVIIFYRVSAEFTVEFELEDGVAKNIQPYLFEDTIREMVKNLSEKLAKKDPALIPKLQFKIEGDSFNAEFEAADAFLRGFSNFELTDIKITPNPINPKGRFNLQLEQVHLISSYYKLDALAVFIPFYGSGTLNLMVTVIDVGGSAKVSWKPSGIQSIKELKLVFGLKESNLRITGLLHNEPMSDIVSTAATECFPEFINTYGERLGELVGKALKNFINSWLPLSSKLVDYNVPSNANGTVQIGPHEIKYLYQLL